MIDSLLRTSTKHSVEAEIAMIIMTKYDHGIEMNNTSYNYKKIGSPRIGHAVQQ